MKDVTFPLPFSEVLDFTAESKPLVRVDYTGSYLDHKGRLQAFFNYASNLGIPTVVREDNLTYADKSDLLASYMAHRSVGCFVNLNIEVADCILRAAGSSRLLSDTPFLTPEERVQFITEHKPTLSRWIVFLQSLIVFTLDCKERMFRNEKSNEAGVTQPTKIRDQFPVINNPTFVGSNIVNLLNIPAFLEYFFACGVDATTLVYFDYQFNQRCFGNRTLYDYLSATQQDFFTALLVSTFAGPGGLALEPATA